MQARMSNPAMIMPEAMQALHGADQVHRTKGGVPAKTLDLVHLRASQINGCSVCVDMHARGARSSPAKPTSAPSPSRPGATRRTSPTPNAPRSRSPKR